MKIKKKEYTTTEYYLEPKEADPIIREFFKIPHDEAIQSIETIAFMEPETFNFFYGLKIKTTK